MRAALLPYARLSAAGFRRRLAYRLAIVAGAVTNSVFGLIRCAVLVAMAEAAGTSLGGYDASSLVTYAFITQALLGPINIWSGTELRDRVRSGDIAVDLARPLDLQAAFLAHDVGSSLASVIPRSLPTLLVGVVVVGARFPTEPVVLLAGLAGLLLGVVVGHLARFLVQTASFWIVETRGLLNLYAGAAGILSGLIMPISLMPDWLRTVAYATPFPALMQYPADLASGRASGPAAATLLAVQLGWVLVLAAAGHAAVVAGSRKLVVAGG